MALAGLAGALGGDAAELLIRRDLIDKLGPPGGVAPVAAPPSLLVNSMAQASRVCSSIPRWTLRPPRRFGLPCLRALHSPSPSTLIPVLLIKRGSGPCEPQQGMLSFRVFWRRQSVRKFAPAQSSPISQPDQPARSASPISRSKLSTNPVVGLSARPKSTFAEEHLRRRAPASSGRPEWRRRWSSAVGHARLRARPPRSSRGRTRSSASRGASTPRHRLARSGSCRSGTPVGSCRPATTPDSQDESHQALWATEPEGMVVRLLGGLGRTGSRCR